VDGAGRCSGDDGVDEDDVVVAVPQVQQPGGVLLGDDPDAGPERYP